MRTQDREQLDLIVRTNVAFFVFPATKRLVRLALRHQFCQMLPALKIGQRQATAKIDQLQANVKEA